MTESLIASSRESLQKDCGHEDSRSEIVVSQLSMEPAGSSQTRVSAAVALPGKEAIEIWFEYDADLEPIECLGDMYVLSLLHMGMQLNADLRIDGSVHSELLENIEWLMEMWCCWHRRYKPIQVFCHEVIDDGESLCDSDEALLLYSGGVDSTFALVQHMEGKLGRRSRKIGHALMVRGADMQLDQSKLWETSLTHATAILDQYEVPLTTVRTNVREVCGHWEHSHGCVLAACSWPWSSTYQELIISGSVSPKNFAEAWGSHPVTDHWIGHRKFKVNPDAVAAFRTGKIECLTNYPTIIPHIRYCYLQGDAELNCGKCFKCIETELGFFAAGADVEPPSLTQIWSLVNAPRWFLFEARNMMKIARRNKRKKTPQLILLRFVISILSFLKE